MVFQVLRSFQVLLQLALLKTFFVKHFFPYFILWLLEMAFENEGHLKVVFQSLF